MKLNDFCISQTLDSLFKTVNIVLKITILMSLTVVYCESHALFHCRQYDDLRNHHLFTWYLGDKYLRNFYSIFTSCKYNFNRKTALYIHKMLSFLESHNLFSFYVLVHANTTHLLYTLYNVFVYNVFLATGHYCKIRII